MLSENHKYHKFWFLVHCGFETAMEYFQMLLFTMFFFSLGQCVYGSSPNIASNSSDLIIFYSGE